MVTPPISTITHTHTHPSECQLQRAAQAWPPACRAVPGTQSVLGTFFWVAHQSWGEGQASPRKSQPLFQRALLVQNRGSGSAAKALSSQGCGGAQPAARRLPAVARATIVITSPGTQRGQLTGERMIWLAHVSSNRPICIHRQIPCWGLEAWEMAPFLLSLPQIREGGIPQAKADRTHQSGLSPRDTGTKPNSLFGKMPTAQGLGEKPSRLLATSPFLYITIANEHYKQWGGFHRFNEHLLDARPTGNFLT